MIKATVLMALLLVASVAEGKVTAATAPAGYVQALETANVFLWAWSNRDDETGVKLISLKLSSKFKKENNEDWFRQYMLGLSNPRHCSFEIGKGRKINSKRFVFPVTLFEYYTGEAKAFSYKSKIVIIKEGALWRIDVLPITSDNE